MKTLTMNQLKNIVQGASLLATGGGGSIESALTLSTQIKKPPQLITIDDLNVNDIVVTVFGVGGIEKCNSILAARAAYQAFKKIFGKKISAIMPVEIGPLAIVDPFFIANSLRLPVLDADIVGFRSSPEVFLETISIPNLPRTPLACANDHGDVMMIYKSNSMEMIEKMTRSFAINSGGDAIIVGYPLNIEQMRNVVGVGSVSFSLSLGNDLHKKVSLRNLCKKNKMIFLGEGIIARETKKLKAGFTIGKYTIKSKEGDFIEICIKNENIVAKRGKKIILTTPDLICLLDTNTYTGINNFVPNRGKKVAIFGRKAIPIWRTKKGKKLFSPKNLGLNFKQKLLL